MTLSETYTALLVAETDMKDHLPALRALAQDKHVVEFGTRLGISTIAMLSGRPRFLYTYDLNWASAIDDIAAQAAAENIGFKFIQEDIDKLTHIPTCDLVFIDAMHNGNSVAIQLQLASNAGATRIALHDTEIFGRVGDLPNTPGIMDAVDAFIALRGYPAWSILSHNPACYGFTVLAR